MTDDSMLGKVGWMDLTVPDAAGVRDFYHKVADWTYDEVSMGDYSDFTMKAKSGDPVGGICHARGSNQGLPTQWLMYIAVADLDASVDACTQNGGQVLGELRDMGSYGWMAVIQDPAGAVCALLGPRHNT